MATKRLPRPRDPLALAKLIGDIATGQVADAVEDGKDAAAVARGRAGGQKGAKSRANSLSAERRAEIARSAARKRWATPS
jgi:hypothetical protein